jgi:thioredoxin-related protein
MRTPNILRLILCLLLLPAILPAASIPLGSSYSDVIEALGEPDGELSAGSKQILTYGDAQVILRNHKVTSISPEFERLLEERDTAKSSVKAKRAANLVSYRGQWITPEKKIQIVQAENKKRSQNRPTPVSTGGWMTDFKQASALAKAENKKMLLNFTGSDWCGWCIKLDNEVFSKPEFIKYANEHYVLVKLDFPKRTAQSSTLKKQNEALAKKYKVRGYPSIVVLSSKGKKYTTGSYVKGGPKAFLASIR